MYSLIINLVFLIIKLILIISGLSAFFYILSLRADAFVAADKLTKRAWLAIIGISTLVHILLFEGLLNMLSLAATVAIIVFWVDVYPKIKEILSAQDKY